MKAIVSTYFPRRNYGFLQAENGEFIFFHASNFRGEPKLGDQVEFELGPANSLGRKPQAMNVTLIKQEASVKAGE